MDSLDFQILCDKTLELAVIPGLMSFCPSMDLVALGTIDNQVCIYRFNGQLVYGASAKLSGSHVDGIRWKSDGKLIATAWSDGFLRLLSAESNKIVYQFSYDYHAARVTCMGWSSNIISTISNPLDIPKEIKKYFQDNEESWKHSASLDLPRDLSLIDIEISLPKLSILPAVGDSEDIFCTRSSLDALFNPFDPKYKNVVDVMVLGTRDGKIHIIIYDSFYVGSFNSSIITGGFSAFLVLHASLEHSSTHALLMKDHETENLIFVAMDLRFISASNGHLSLLSSCSTALQNLLRYIHQIQLLTIGEWKSIQEIQSRFTRNVNEELKERRNCGIVQALCHSVATGHYFQPVKEWLVHELSERGHKRWDKAVITGLENLKRIVHENMLPALERCSVILSRFFGISKFQAFDNTVGFTSEEITLLMDSVACLNLVSSKILMQVVDEIELFTSFSIWLRHEIDHLSSDTSSDLADESTEKESLIDHNKVLLYLQTVMTSSSLADHFVESTTLDETKNFIQEQKPLFEILSAELEKQRNNQNYHKSVLSVKFLFENLSTKANAIFNQIAEAERRNVSFGKQYQIGAPEPNSPMDMILDMDIDMISEIKSFQSYIAFVPKEHPNHLRVVRVKISIQDSTSLIDSIESYALQISGCSIKDIKFSGQDSIFVLLIDNTSTKLFSLPYKNTNQISLKDLNIKYAPHNPPHLVSSPIIIDKIDASKFFSKHKIPTEKHFLPEKLAVGHRNHRLSKNQRLILLGEKGCHYKVLEYEK